MAQDYVSVEAVGIDTIIRAMKAAPDITYRYVGGEFKRGANRFRKELIKGWGIKWSGSKKVGKNVRAIVEGDRLESLTARIQLSSFLSMHETGGTMRSEHGSLAIALQDGLPYKPMKLGEKLIVVIAKDGKAYLARKRKAEEKGGALRDKSGKFVSRKFEGDLELLYKLTSSVQMKPRLGMRTMWDAYVPGFVQRINAAVDRAAKVTFDQNVKMVSGAFQRAVL